MISAAPAHDSGAITLFKPTRVFDAGIMCDRYRRADMTAGLPTHRWIAMNAFGGELTPAMEMTIG